jgi:hypothetical protein
VFTHDSDFLSHCSQLPFLPASLRTLIA